MIRSLCSVLLLHTQTFLLFSASCSYDTGRLSFLDCFECNEIVLPYVDGKKIPTHLEPFNIGVCRAVSRTANSNKYLASKDSTGSTSTYSFREVQGWIGFIEGEDKALLKMFADRLSTDGRWRAHLQRAQALMQNDAPRPMRMDVQMHEKLD